MKKFLIVTLLFISCNENKTYTYIEHVKDPDLFGNGYSSKDKDPVIIEAPNDQKAYSEAYKNFTISKKVLKDMNEVYGHSAIPISFDILNDKNEDISNKVDYLSKDSIEREIDKTISRLKTTIKEHYDSSQKVIAVKSKECPVKILSSHPVSEEYSNYKSVYLSYKNVSKKTIIAIRFRWTGTNAFGEPADMGIKDGEGAGFSDDKLRAGKVDDGTWEILSKDLKKITKAWVYEVSFEDGTKWEMEE